MQYYNLKNPTDKNKKEWVNIPRANSNVFDKDDKDSRDMWDAVNQSSFNIDAGVLQEALEKEGLVVSHNPDHTPNGVTVSSAGVLITFENTLTSAEEAKLNSILRDVAKNTDKYKSVDREDGRTIEGPHYSDEGGGGKISP